MTSEKDVVNDWVRNHKEKLDNSDNLLEIARRLERRAKEATSYGTLAFDSMIPSYSQPIIADMDNTAETAHAAMPFDISSMHLWEQPLHHYMANHATSLIATSGQMVLDCAIDNLKTDLVFTGVSVDAGDSLCLVEADPMVVEDDTPLHTKAIRATERIVNMKKFECRWCEELQGRGCNALEDKTAAEMAIVLLETIVPSGDRIDAGRLALTQPDEGTVIEELL